MGIKNQIETLPVAKKKIINISQGMPYSMLAVDVRATIVCHLFFAKAIMHCHSGSATRMAVLYYSFLNVLAVVCI